MLVQQRCKDGSLPGGRLASGHRIFDNARPFPTFAEQTFSGSIFNIHDCDRGSQDIVRLMYGRIWMNQ